MKLVSGVEPAYSCGLGDGGIGGLQQSQLMEASMAVCGLEQPTMLTEIRGVGDVEMVSTRPHAGNR